MHDSEIVTRNENPYYGKCHHFFRLPNDDEQTPELGKPGLAKLCAVIASEVGKEHSVPLSPNKISDWSQV